MKQNDQSNAEFAFRLLPFAITSYTQGSRASVGRSVRARRIGIPLGDCSMESRIRHLLLALAVSLGQLRSPLGIFQFLRAFSSLLDDCIMTTLELIKDLQRLPEQEVRGENPAVVHSQLLDGIQKLKTSVTTPADKLFHMRFDICQTVCVRIAQQCGILRSLSNNGCATAAELSMPPCANELLIGMWPLSPQ